MCLHGQASGLALADADLDITVLAPAGKDLTGKAKQVKLLRQVDKLLREAGLLDASRDLITNAKVPIIKGAVRHGAHAGVSAVQ
jgi:hypothetical protein